jgi:hypothetical protein
MCHSPLNLSLSREAIPCPSVEILEAREKKGEFRAGKWVSGNPYRAGSEALTGIWAVGNLADTFSITLNLPGLPG